MMANNQCWSVYVHTLPNGKVYVGVTGTPPKKRWNYGYGYQKQTLFFNDIKKYGWKNIVHIIVAEGLTKTQAYKLETDLIKKYRSKEIEYGYNQAGGGNGTTGFYPSEKSRRKMAESHKGQQNHCTPTYQINTYGEVVAKYSSIKEASKITGVNYKSIVNCCSGVTKQAGGYYWRH